MEYKILSASSPEELTKQVTELMNVGWKPVGSHSVVETHRQNRYRGQQHIGIRKDNKYTGALTIHSLY
jgi:hypothetical protein